MDKTGLAETSALGAGDELDSLCRDRAQGKALEWNSSFPYKVST
jgi:hypothetical protein